MFSRNLETSETGFESGLSRFPHCSYHQNIQMPSGSALFNGTQFSQTSFVIPPNSFSAHRSEIMSLARILDNKKAESARSLKRNHTKCVLFFPNFLQFSGDSNAGTMRCILPYLKLFETVTSWDVVFSVRFDLTLCILVQRTFLQTLAQHINPGIKSWMLSSHHGPSRRTTSDNLFWLENQLHPPWLHVRKCVLREEKLSICGSL